MTLDKAKRREGEWMNDKSNQYTNHNHAMNENATYTKRIGDIFCSEW